MSNLNVAKLEILQDELITPEEEAKMNEIICLVNSLYRGEIESNKVLPAINNLPKYSVNNKKYLVSRYKECIYMLALYVCYLDKFDIFQDKTVVDIVNEELNNEIETFPVYNEGVPESLRELITTARCRTRKGNVDYDLMVALFDYKYASEFPYLLEDYKAAIRSKNNKIAEKNGIIRGIKKLGAQIALYTMLSIPIYSLPAIGAASIFNRIYTEKEHALEINDDDNNKIKGYYEYIPFAGSFPEDYNKQKLQYVTEFGETVDGKVAIKVYDYTGVNVSKETINDIDLDENRLVYFNIQKVSNRMKNSESTWLRDYLGTYTGKAHRNIATIEDHLYVTRDDVSFWVATILTSVCMYAIIVIYHLELHNKGKYILFDKVLQLINNRKVTVSTKEEAEREIERIKKEIDSLAEIALINFRTEQPEVYNEKFYKKASEEFEKKLRR